MFTSREVEFIFYGAKVLVFLFCVVVLKFTNVVNCHMSDKILPSY
jgi:hypothetical protein